MRRVRGTKARLIDEVEIEVVVKKWEVAMDIYFVPSASQKFRRVQCESARLARRSEGGEKC
jgi:hypothetical protein